MGIKLDPRYQVEAYEAIQNSIKKPKKTNNKKRNKKIKK